MNDRRRYKLKQMMVFLNNAKRVFTNILRLAPHSSMLKHELFSKILRTLDEAAHKSHVLPQQVECKTFVCDTRISHCHIRRSACATSSVFAEVL